MKRAGAAPVKGMPPLHEMPREDSTMEAAQAMPKLWELGDELEAIRMELAENEGELTPEMEARLDALSGAWEEKVERVALAARVAKVDGEAAATEAARLGRMARSHTRSYDALKGYLHRELERQGKPKVEMPRARVRIQANSQVSVQVNVPPEHLPEHMQRVKVEADIKAILAAFQGGGPLPAGVTVERGTHVRIY